MFKASAARSISVVLSVALLASACGAGEPSGPSRPSASAARSTTGPSPAVSVVATASATSAAATASSPTSAEPPAASMAVDGGDPVAGQLGSFTWGDGGSDSPWLPGAPIRVGAGEPLIVAIGDGIAVARWTARRVRAGTANGIGAVGLGDGDARISFQPPPAGTWSVQVAVQFATNMGSATYYWQVTVR